MTNVWGDSSTKLITTIGQTKVTKLSSNIAAEMKELRAQSEAARADLQKLLGKPKVNAKDTKKETCAAAKHVKKAKTVSIMARAHKRS